LVVSANVVTTTDLIAGGGSPAGAMDVGDVEVWNDGDDLHVKYVIGDPDWCITETHLHVADDMSGIPQKKGNPPPGKFEYKGEHECVSEVAYEVPLDGLSGDIAIAAHAVVSQQGDGECSLPMIDLPTAVTLTLAHPGIGFGEPSYFDSTLSGGTDIDGTYDGWCVDADLTADTGTTYTAIPYATDGPIPAGLIENPDNLDLVNYILNQGYVGQPAGCGSEVYTYGDVQMAIWQLLDDALPVDTSSAGPLSTCGTAAILADAMANGEGFEPGAGEVLGVILVPYDDDPETPIAQISIIGIPVECEPEGGDETAWGAGPDFPGKNWAMYIEYEIQGGSPD
jgi:hypothetical protein